MEIREVKLYKFSATSTAWLILSLLLLGMFTYAMAIATPAWGVTHVAQHAYQVSGLWSRCTHNNGQQHCRSLVGTEGVSNLIVAAQGISVFGSAGICLAVMVAVVYICVTVFRKDARTALVLAILCFSAGLFIVLVCVTFALGDQQDAPRVRPKSHTVCFTLSTSFGCALFCAIMVIACGGLSVFEMFTTKHENPA